MSGMDELDDALGGFQTGELVVISGVTGNGKTLFAKTLVRNLSLLSAPCACFSYEVSTEEFLKYFKSSRYDDAKMFVTQEMKVGMMKWIYDRVHESKLKYGTNVVLIDHLHYIVDMDTDKMTINVGACMRRLKQLAVELNQVVIIVAHQEKLKDDKEPGIETLRDSSFVGQEADDVIIVHRVPDDPSQKGNNRTYEDGFAVVKIDKARRKGTYKRRLTFQKKGDWLEPV